MENEENEKKEKSFYESEHYYSLKDAVNEISDINDTKENVVAGAKLLGKGLFNLGLFAGKLAAKAAEELPGAVANQAQRVLDKNENLTDSQKSKLEEYVEKHKK